VKGSLHADVLYLCLQMMQMSARCMGYRCVQDGNPRSFLVLVSPALIPELHLSCARNS